MAEVNKGTSLFSANLNSVLDSIVADLTLVRTAANYNSSSIALLKTGVNSAISDLGTVHTAVNLAVSKLNADGGVSDANYAAITALGGSAVTTLTAGTVTTLGTTTD